MSSTPEEQRNHPKIRNVPYDMVKHLEDAATIAYERYVESGHKDLGMEDLAADLQFASYNARAVLEDLQMYRELHQGAVSAELPPLEVTEEDREKALHRPLPAYLLPDNLENIVGWWKKMFTELGGVAECRERQLKQLLAERHMMADIIVRAARTLEITRQEMAFTGPQVLHLGESVVAVLEQNKETTHEQ